MSTSGTDAVIEPAATTARPGSVSPRRIHLRDLISLYSRPRWFFSGELDLGAPLYYGAVIWLGGITAQLDRIDTEILRYQLDQARPTWQVIEPLVTGSWLFFWTFSLLLGIVSAAVIYLIGGWWYGLRVRWSGARDFDKSRARRVYLWSGLVISLPYFLLTAYQTATYPNYLAAYNSSSSVGFLLIASMFWSIGVSYVGVRASFDLTPWKARIWFLALPGVFYLFALGLIVGLMAYLS